MSLRHDLLVVGDCDCDLFIAVDEPPAVGAKAMGRLLASRVGGMAVNVAANAAALGLRTALASRVGDDELGRAALGYLAAAGVDTSAVEIDGGIATYLGIVHLNSAGEKSLLVADGGALFPSPAAAEAIDVAETRAVHLAPFDLDVAVGIARRAAEAGVVVSVDLERIMIERGSPATIDALLAATEVLFLNEFAAELFDPEIERALEILHERGPVVVVATRGASGAIVSAAGVVVVVPAVPAEIIDTTGAGDAFAAGFLSMYLRSETPDGLRAAAAEGARVAARSMSAFGGSQALVLGAAR